MKRASGCIHHVEIIISVLGELPLPFLEWPIWAVYSTVNGMSVETLAYSRIAYLILWTMQTLGLQYVQLCSEFCDFIS